MLYDPKWERMNPLSLDALISWLRLKPTDDQYDYLSHRRCLAAQYKASIGRTYRTPFIWASIKWLCGRKFDWQLERITIQHPRTFGAALERAIAKRASAA